LYFSNNKSNDTGKDTIGTKTFKQDRKFTYNVTLRKVRATIAAVEKH